MSHNHTLPEEVEIILRELEENEKKSEEIAKKDKHKNAPDGWYARYIPPYRAAYLGGKENTNESRQSS